MSIFDKLSKESQKELYKKSIKEGDVFLKDFEEADHKKFFIIAGISGDKVFVCSVFINSNIHPSIKNKQRLLALQVPLKKTLNPFLSYDSFANCAYPIPLETDTITTSIINGGCKVIGCIDPSDLDNVQQSLIHSGLLSEEQIDLYFKKWH